MKKITSLLGLTLLSLFSLQAQEKLSANFGVGLGIPFVELNQNTYQGYKPNLGVSGGIGYNLSPEARVRLDFLALQLNGNNATNYFQNQTYEGAAAIEYNLLGLFSDKPRYKLNALGGLGAGITNSILYDINSRQKVTEVPAQEPGGTGFSIQTFVLLGLNVGIPVTDKIDINISYGHRVLWFQPWVDAFNPESFDTYGVLMVGTQFTLKSDRDKSKIEVDPKKFNQLKAKADSSERFESQANRNAEKVGRLEMSNQEKDMQIAMLRNEVDSLKANPVVKEKSTQTANNKTQSSAVASDADLGEAQYRVIVVSSPTRSGAQKFIDRTKLDKDEMQIAYIERLDTYRVIYKSSTSISEAKAARKEARKYYSDAWIAKF